VAAAAVVVVIGVVHEAGVILLQDEGDPPPTLRIEVLREAALGLGHPMIAAKTKMASFSNIGIFVSNFLIAAGVDLKFSFSLFFYYCLIAKFLNSMKNYSADNKNSGYFFQTTTVLPVVVFYFI